LKAGLAPLVGVFSASSIGWRHDAASHTTLTPIAGGRRHLRHAITPLMTPLRHYFHAETFTPRPPFDYATLLFTSH
jgi:hypothetical protein